MKLKLVMQKFKNQHLTHSPMRINHLLLTAVILFITLCACSKKQEGEPSTLMQENNAPAATETAMATVESDDETDMESSEMDDEAVTPLAAIKKQWRTFSFAVKPGDATPGIKQFTFAFVTYYPAFEPNKALIDYITSPKGYDPEKTGCVITDNERQGHLRSSAMSQYSKETTCCYWKRQNGHRLVAFWMLEEHEDSNTDCRVPAFYDYDPKADLMKPEPALTDMVEQIAKGYDAYNVKLPVEGKDIEVVCYRFNEDSAKDFSFIMKWNGQSFDAPK